MLGSGSIHIDIALQIDFDDAANRVRSSASDLAVSRGYFHLQSHLFSLRTLILADISYIHKIRVPISNT